MKKVKLQDVCEIIQGGRHKLSGKHFVENGFPAYGAGGLNGYLETYEFEKPAVVLSSIGARCGKCFYADGKWSSLANTQIFFPDELLVDAKFLWYQLNDETRWIRSGTAQPFIKPSNIKNHLISLPPLPEQKRIAEVLDKADALRKKRRLALQKLDTLLQSVFLEMFGDPVKNPKGFQIVSLRNTALKFSDGPFGSNLKTSHYTESGVRVIRLQNVGIGELVGNDKSFISQDYYNSLPKHHCKSGDVIIGTMGNPNLRACILPDSVEQALNKADCILLRPNLKIASAEYLCWLLNSDSIIQSANKLSLGQTRLRISMGRLRELQVPLPPIELQNKFSKAVKTIEVLKNKAIESSQKTENLFQSLQKRAFKGELFNDEFSAVESQDEKVWQQTSLF